MKHKNGFNPLSRTASHRRAMHRNMVTSLFKYERVTTTKAKALEVRRTAEKLITRSKVDTVHNRRQAASMYRTRQFSPSSLPKSTPHERPRWWIPAFSNSVSVRVTQRKLQSSNW